MLTKEEKVASHIPEVRSWFSVQTRMIKLGARDFNKHLLLLEAVTLKAITTGIVLGNTVERVTGNRSPNEFYFRIHVIVLG